MNVYTVAEVIKLQNKWVRFFPVWIFHCPWETPLLFFYSFPTASVVRPARLAGHLESHEAVLILPNGLGIV